MSSMTTPIESVLPSPRTARRPSLPMIGIVVAIALLVVGGGILLGRESGDAAPTALTPQVTTPAAATPGQPAAPSDVSAVLGAFTYPVAWTPEALTGPDQQVGIALKLQRTGPDGSFMARRLDGKLAQPFDMAALAVSTEQGLLAAIKDFQLVGTEQLRAGEQNYLQITYNQNQLPTAFTNQLVVVPTAERTFFLTFRSAAGDWAKVEGEARQMATSFVDAL